MVLIAYIIFISIFRSIFIAICNVFCASLRLILKKSPTGSHLSLSNATLHKDTFTDFSICTNIVQRQYMVFTLLKELDDVIYRNARIQSS